MATTFKTLTSGMDASVVDEGVAFLDTSGSGLVAVRQGGNVYTITKDQAQQAGINVSTLPAYNITDTGFQYARNLLGGSTTSIAPTAFQTYISSTGAPKTYQQSLSPVNPQGSNWTETTTGQNVVSSPAIGQTAGYIGVTTDQLAQGVTAAATINPFSIAPAQPPTNASQINPVGSPVMPSGTPTTGNVSNALGATTGAKTMQDYLLKEADAANAAAEKAQSNQNSLLAQFFGSNQPTSAQTRESAMQQYGIQSKVAEIETLSQEYNKFQQGMEEQIAAVNDKYASTGFINRESAAIERRYAPRLNRLSADINLKTAILTQNQEFVKQAVQDATADREYRFKQFEFFYNANQDNINRLDDKYQTAFQNAFQLARDEWQNAVKEKQQVAEWALKYGNGITMEDSLQTALAKAQRSPLFRYETSGAFTLSPGEMRFDAQGNLIATGGDKPETTLNTAEINYLNDTYGVSVPLGTTQSRADQIFFGWTGDDTKKYQKNTNGFRDIVDGMLAGSIPIPAGTVAEEPATTEPEPQKTALQIAIEQLRAQNAQMGFPQDTGLRESLVRRGFNVQEVDMALHPFRTTASNLWNKLWGQ